MEHSHKTNLLVNEFMQLLIRRDINVVNLFSESPDWYIQGNKSVAPWLGKRSNREEVRDAFELLWSHIKPVSGRIEHIIVDGDFAIVTGEFITTIVKTNKVVNSLFCMLFKVENDCIVKFRLFEDTYAVFAASQE